MYKTYCGWIWKDNEPSLELTLYFEGKAINLDTSIILLNNIKIDADMKDHRIPYLQGQKDIYYGRIEKCHKNLHPSTSQRILLTTQ